MRALFWVSAFLALYPYLIFPALLVVMRHVIARPPRKAPIEPTVAMLVAAYNEEHVIAAKIENSLAIDYPADRLETVIRSEEHTSELQSRLHLVCRLLLEKKKKKTKKL